MLCCKQAIMELLEVIMVLGWLIWFALYWQLAWNKGTTRGRSYSKMAFPILLFYGNAWPPGTELQRLKLQGSLLLLVVIAAVVELVAVNAT